MLAFNFKAPRSVWVKRVLIIAIAALVLGFIIWKVLSPKTDPNAMRQRMRMQVPPVQTATAEIRSVPRYLTGLGSAQAAKTVSVISRVSGELMSLHFKEGQQVNAGDLLAQIDPRPFEVELKKAQGQLAKDQATLDNAKQNLARYQNLVKTNLISKQELDAQLMAVRQSEGAVQMDKSAVESAQLQLDYSKITAPIDGRVGLKRVDIGNYVSSSATEGLVVITQTHPIDVIFTLPESNISDLIKAQQAGDIAVEAWDKNNMQLLEIGKLVSLDNQIDATTGTIKLKARFSNQDDLLFPNQFVNVRLKVATLDDSTVIPTAALQMSSQGHFVWTLDDNNKVNKKNVTAGMQNDDIVVITEGLNDGERVVTDGVDRLVQGMSVDVVDATIVPAAPKLDPETTEDTTADKAQSGDA